MSTKAPVSPMGGKSAPAPAAAPVKTPTRVSKVDPNETPEAKFKRLAVGRVEKNLNGIRQLKTLARLKPTPEHREKVFKALRDALATAENSWKGETVATEGFNL